MPGFSVRHKVLIGVGLLAIVMVVASTLSLVQVRSLSTLHREFVDEQFAILTHVEGAALDASRAATAERGYLLAGNSRFVEEVRVEHLPAVRDHLDAAAGVNPDAVGLLTPVNEAFVAWTDSLEEEFDLYTRDPFSAQMMAFINPLAQRLEFEEALAAVTEATTAAVAEADAQFDAAAARARAITLGTLVAGVLAVIGGWLLSKNVARQVDGSVAALGASSTELVDLSHLMGTEAAQVTDRAAAANAASHDVDASVRSVAVAIEQLNGSIHDVARRAQDALAAAESAVATAEETTESVARLDNSSTRIGTVLDTITAIAGQTNMLALNATIEAARAGEAGRGFVVVANEVKDLSQKTAAATREIGASITAIQADSDAAATSITRIQDVISHLAGLSTAIAATVEEQTAATEAISQSMGNASRATTAISTSIEELAATSVRTSARAAEAGAAAARLEGVANALGGDRQPRPDASAAGGDGLHGPDEDHDGAVDAHEDTASSVPGVVTDEDIRRLLSS
ncbi:methyl-accepting chemotaxis protein [Euzebya rosea]|uniref:methyl-accepting chemotaxis protein n=1 Tax=Euzebya rosea TaxID=2052804 RepID=UPI001474AEE2|nr:methyl-accepting chemotaxis protein [Euzebya rosea]